MSPCSASGGGASSVFDQALTLQLYDPQRARELTHEGKTLAWRSFLAQVEQRATALAADGEVVAVVRSQSAQLAA